MPPFSLPSSVRRPSRRARSSKPARIILFAYSGNEPAIDATCLRANGTPNHTSLIIKGIGNNNGTLVQSGSGNSTFQESCGNILIVVESPTEVALTAFCRTGSGASNRTMLPLNNIGNNNGNLTQ